MSDKESIRLGFAGVRSGMTLRQRGKTEEVLKKLNDLYNVTLLHGDTKGGDEIVHAEAKRLGIRIEAYPTAEPDFRAFLEGVDVVHTPTPFLERYRLIAESCDVLLSCPSSMDDTSKSGVWLTTNNVLFKGKKVYIVAPKGWLFAGER